MRIIALDVGEKRIGTAVADSNIRIALPRLMISTDGRELDAVVDFFGRERAQAIVVGLPRNNSGETTRQTESVEAFVEKLKENFARKNLSPVFVFQDESWTSEAAKDHLAAKKHEITKKDRDSGAIDSEAAAIILQDFLESPRLYDVEAQIKTSGL